MNLLVQNVIEREIKREKVQMKPPFEVVFQTFKIDNTELVFFCMIFHLLVSKIEIFPQIHFGRKFPKTAKAKRRAVRHMPPANLAVVGLAVLLACKQGWARIDRSRGATVAAAAFRGCRGGLPRRGVQRLASKGEPEETVAAAQRRRRPSVGAAVAHRGAAYGGLQARLSQKRP